MRFTLALRGETRTHELDTGFELGGDPVAGPIALGRRKPWCARFAKSGETWRVEVRGAYETTLDGEPIGGERDRELDFGSVLAVGELVVVVGYDVAALPRVRALSAFERDLLAAIARDDGDDARRVLADLWQRGDDEPRGTLVHAQCEGAGFARELVRAHGPRWYRHLEHAGFRPGDLELDCGFAPPIVLSATEPLARSPDALRLSPVHYHRRELVSHGFRVAVWKAVRVTAAGPGELVALKLARDEVGAELVERELAVLWRCNSAHVPRGERAISRHGPALALAWAGDNLRRIRDRTRVIGEAVALAIGIQLCRILAAVHAAGVVHAQVEPHNVLVAGDGHVTLCDFSEARGDGLPPPYTEVLTAGWIPAYRYGYMSPDQVRGLPLDGGTDVFALAVVLAELVAGVHPLGDVHSDMETIEAIRDLRFRLPTTRSRLGAKLRELLGADPVPRASAHALGLELARIAEDAHLRVGADVLADVIG